jgi:hypothetical protein
MSSSTWRSIGGRDSEGGPEWLPASPFLVGARFAGDPPTFALARFAGPSGTVAFSVLAHIVTGVKP